MTTSMIYGFISNNDDFHLYAMPSMNWTLDFNKRYQKKGGSWKDKGKGAALLKESIRVLGEDNIVKWLASRSEFMIDPEQVHDEMVERDGGLEDCMDILPAIWINIDKRIMTVLESSVGEIHLDRYLPAGWTYATVDSLKELEDLLPEETIYWESETEIVDPEDAEFVYEEEEEEEEDDDWGLEDDLQDGFHDATFEEELEEEEEEEEDEEPEPDFDDEDDDF